MTEIKPEALIEEAARLIEPEDGEAVFYVRVGGSRTQMRVKTKGQVDPEAALRNAIAALNGERKALSNCPVHRTPDPSLITGLREARDALKLGLEYWGHRQQRYKNRSPVWVQHARATLGHLDSLLAGDGS